MPLNISGPFLKRHQIDQLHTKNCLKVQTYEIPLLAHVTDFDTFETSCSPIFTNNACTIPPCSLTLIPATVQAISRRRMPKSGGGVTGHFDFMQRSNCHPWLNALVNPESDGTILVGVLNTLGVPITIPAKSYYGTYTLICSVQQQARYPWRLAVLDNTIQPTTAVASIMDADIPSFMQGPTNATNVAKRKAFLTTAFNLQSADQLKTVAQRDQVLNLILKYLDVFSFDGGFGTTNLITHTIYTEPGPPINQRYRPINPALEAQLKKQIDEWIAHDVIEPSSSPWNFGLVAVPKKNGKTRWCVDFRALNARSKRDTHPIGSIEDNLVRLSYSKVFSGLDASGAFHVVPLEEESKEKTAFATPFGSYQFKRLPFGLANGPATYARLVKLVLQGIPSSVALPYLDDVIVHSPSMLQHFQDLDNIFNAYRKAGLKLQPAKCQLFRSQIDYLGHTVSERGIAPLSKYVEVVKTWPIPKTRQQTRAFLGKVGYYRRFIKDFAAIARPLTDKLSLDGTTDKTEFTITPEIKAAFLKLQKALLTAPILAYPRFDSPNPFIVDTDWSMENAAIGGVLSQQQEGLERVIAYGAHKLLPSQTRYGVTKGELYGIIYFLQYWKYFLQYRPFIVRTDHMSLKYIHTMAAPTGMIQRWLYILSSYDFTIQHRAGSKHANADGLSRAPHLTNNGIPSTIEDEDVSVHALREIRNLEGLTLDAAENSQKDDEKKGGDVGLPTSKWILSLETQDRFNDTLWKTWSPQYLKSHQLNDPDINFLFYYVKNRNTVPSHLIKSLSPIGRIYAGLLSSLYIDNAQILRLKLPSSKNPLESCRHVILLPQLLIKPAVLRVHKQIAHLGPQATYDKLRLYAYFPHMLQTIRQMLLTCGPCQTKTTRLPDQRHTLFSRRSGYPFQTLAIDFVGPLPLSHPHRFQYLFTIKDTFTRWMEAFPIRRMDTKTVLDILNREIFPRYGYCEQIHSDRGAQFTSQAMKELGEALKIKISQTPAYNAKSNPVERGHRDLKAALNALTQHKPTAWPDYIPAILYAFRCSVSASTGFSPFQLMYGRSPIEDLDLIMPSPSYVNQLRTAPDYFAELTQRLTQAHHLARENMRLAVERQRNNYQRKPKQYAVNDLVWLFTPILFERKTPKFVTGWSGPWTIIKQINDLMYTIRFQSDKEDLDTPPREETVSIDRLRKYYPNAYDEPKLLPPPTQSTLTGDEFALMIPAKQSPLHTHNTSTDKSDKFPKSSTPTTNSPILDDNNDNNDSENQATDTERSLSIDENEPYDPIARWTIETGEHDQHVFDDFNYTERLPLMEDPTLTVSIPTNIPQINDQITSAAKMKPINQNHTFEAAYARYKPDENCQRNRRERYLEREYVKQLPVSDAPDHATSPGDAPDSPNSTGEKV